MSFSCGVVGFPNVGKSTLFNALTLSEGAESANYPFCTITPNTGQVTIPDTRLYRLAECENSKSIIQNTLKLVDIAGLVEGASQGAGLGNKFLDDIRKVDVIIHVLRCFENADITHVQESVDPVRDCDMIETELLLSDIQVLESWLGKKKINDLYPKSLVEKVLNHCNQGRYVRFMSDLSDDESKIIHHWGLLTNKPILYVCNAHHSASHWIEKVQDHVNDSVIAVNAHLEMEMASWSYEERQAYLKSEGWENSGLDQVILKGHKLLNLITFFTVGPKEARAWSVLKGSSAPQAAGCIHTDFEKNFIRAEVITYNDYIQYGGLAALKQAGCINLRGKDYIVQDGDVIHILSSA